MKNRHVLALLILLVSANTDVVADKIYKWVDDNGKVHYSDRPPPKRLRDSAEISTDLKPVNKSQAGAEIVRLQRVFPQQSAAERAYRERQQRRTEQQQRERDLACQRARADLKTLRGPVVFIDENGKRFSVSEEERERRAKELEQLIAENC